MTPQEEREAIIKDLKQHMMLLEGEYWQVSGFIISDRRERDARIDKALKILRATEFFYSFKTEDEQQGNKIRIDAIDSAIRSLKGE